MNALLSRYAESVFWMARYFERAESLARVLETQTSFQRGLAGENSWAWIVALYSDQEAFGKAFPEPNAANVIRFYMAHLENPGSVQSCIRSARENARALRPMLSTDMWYQLNDFYNRLLAFGPSDYSETRLSRTCDAIKRGCYAQIGVAENTFYHDEAWPFFRLGLYIERADQMSRLLDVRFALQQTSGSADFARFDFSFWVILLRSASAFHTYRRLFPQKTDPHDIACFLTFDPKLPRSIAFCLEEIRETARLLRARFGLEHAREAQTMVNAIIERLDGIRDKGQLLAGLHDFNEGMQQSLADLTQELGRTFFGQTAEAAA